MILKKWKNKYKSNFPDSVYMSKCQGSNLIKNKRNENKNEYQLFNKQWMHL